MAVNSDRWFPLISALFVTSLIISNIIAVKLVVILGWPLPAAVILFPLAYILGDVLTEVYGYARARQTIWIGFLCNLVAVVAISVGGWLPAASFWDAGGAFGSADAAQVAYMAIFGFSFRLLIASFLAYLVGEFLNSYILAKLKVRTGGRHLWLRTISSTIVGQAVDSAIFISIAFTGIIPLENMIEAIVSQWIFKVVYEVVATPITYRVVGFLKRSEGLDHYDRDTRYSPFHMSRS
jgi:uncharacterized integral membrane protein (TIGR00697 family)